MSDNFHLLMNAIDDDLLEEAMMPVKRRKPYPWIGAAVAACLVVAIGLTMFLGRVAVVSYAQLAEMGYEIKLPKEAEDVRYQLITLAEEKGAQASFEIKDTKYVYQTVKTSAQKPLSDSDNGQVLSWNTGDVSIQLLILIVNHL